MTKRVLLKIINMLWSRISIFRLLQEYFFVHTEHKELLICQFLGNFFLNFSYPGKWSLWTNSLLQKLTKKKEKESDSEKMCGTPLGKKALEINPGPNWIKGAAAICPRLCTSSLPGRKQWGKSILEFAFFFFLEDRFQ